MHLKVDSWKNLETAVRHMQSIKLNGGSQSCTEYTSKSSPKSCTPTWGQAVTDQTVFSLANPVETKLQTSRGISDVYVEEGVGRGKSISEWWSPPHSNRQQPIETTMSLSGDAVMSSGCTFCLAVACCRHQYRAKHALLSVLSPWDSALSSGTYIAWVIKTKSGSGKHIIHQNNVGEIINEG